MIKKNNQGIYQIEELLLPGLVHGFSTKSFGNMAFKYGDKEEVFNNRQNFYKALSIQPSVACSNLVHGTKIAHVDKPGEIEFADGLITDKTGLALQIVTGDCMPIIFYDTKKRILGLAHSGYKGTIGKIYLLVIGKMVSAFGCNPKNILVGIGPAIEKCCHVDPSPFLQESLPEWKNYLVAEKNNMTRVDLSGFAKAQMQEVGIKPENIFHANFCTKDHNDEFYCSQFETAGIAKPGRFATIVQMI